jgi:hypothetical protein
MSCQVPLAAKLLWVAAGICVSSVSKKGTVPGARRHAPAKCCWARPLLAAHAQVGLAAGHHGGGDLAGGRVAAAHGV